MSTHTDDSPFSVGPGFARFHRNPAPYDYLTGVVFTPWGVVVVYAEGGNHPITKLETIHLKTGRVRVRIYRRQLTERGIITAAKRFAREVAR